MPSRPSPGGAWRSMSCSHDGRRLGTAPRAENGLSSPNLQDAFAAALQHHRAGRLGEAEALYRKVLAAQPNHADALHFLGLIADQTGRPDAALELIRGAISINPSTASYHYNAGLILAKLGKLDEAIESCRRAVRLDPRHVQAWLILAAALKARGCNDDALEARRRAAAVAPDDADVQHQLGLALAASGHRDEAIAAYQRTLVIKSDHLAALTDLGNLLAASARFDEAVACYRRAIELRPDYAPGHNNLGAALAEMGETAEAVACCRRALQLRPNYPDALNNLGNALAAAGQLGEAIDCYRRALALSPDFAQAHYNLGNALRDTRELDGAIASYRRAIALRPTYAEAHNNLATVLRDTGRLDDAVTHCRKALDIAASPRAASNLIYTLHFHPAATQQQVREAQAQWNERFARPLAAAISPHANDRTHERRLRIGYVSPDFRDHVIGRNVLPLLREHDHQQFEIFCYADVSRPDAITERFKSYADQWRSIVGMTDERLAALVREDGIDILVDLTLHLSGNRLLAFARKPAPIQVTFAGYPAGTGLDAIDYRLSDPYLDPPGTGDGNYAERTVRLPHTFWCYEPDEGGPDVGSLPALAAGHVTFGCLSNFCKVNAPVLRLWSKVLATVPDSRMLLLCPRGEHRTTTLDAFAAEAIDPARIELVEPGPRRQYLEHYRRIDVALDTFPYNGHTTSIDALWMGVPVVTLVRDSSLGRAGWSQLSNLNLRDLAAHQEDEYVAIASKLAEDIRRLSELRLTLRERMRVSPLMDATNFARGIETACRQMWRAWRERA